LQYWQLQSLFAAFAQFSENTMPPVAEFYYGSSAHLWHVLDQYQVLHMTRLRCFKLPSYRTYTKVQHYGIYRAL